MNLTIATGEVTSALMRRYSALVSKRQHSVPQVLMPCTYLGSSESRRQPIRRQPLSEWMLYLKTVLFESRDESGWVLLALESSSKTVVLYDPSHQVDSEDGKDWARSAITVSLAVHSSMRQMVNSQAFVADVNRVNGTMDLFSEGNVTVAELSQPCAPRTTDSGVYVLQAIECLSRLNQATWSKGSHDVDLLFDIRYLDGWTDIRHIVAHELESSALYVRRPSGEQPFRCYQAVVATSKAGVETNRSGSEGPQVYLPP